MYVSEVEGQKLTLAVSGKLWNRSLVMIDLETKSLWSHLLGEAMEGPLKGKPLKSIPSTITDWKTWKRDHPTTSVLNMSRTAERFRVNFYRDPAKFVYGMADGDARAWPLDQLKKQPVVNDKHGEAPVLIVFDPATVTAWAYDQRVGERTLTFSMRDDGVIVDESTGSTWNFATGVAADGPLKETTLKPIAAILSYARAWKTFHPETTLWQAP